MKIKNINIANSVINLSDKEKLQKINDLINEVIRISTETIEEIENNISTDNDSEDAQWDLAANEGRIMLAEEIQSILLK